MKKFFFRLRQMIRQAFIWPIRMYKKHISSHLPDACRFEPTCSVYAMEAIEKRGVFVGIALAVWRILRCNPFGKGGYDPVPLSRTQRKEEMARNEKDKQTGQAEYKDA